MKIMIDTNVILDVLGKREPFLENSSKILMLAAQGKLTASVTTNTIMDIYYLLKKHIRNNEGIKSVLLDLTNLTTVLDVTKADMTKAFELPMNYYEDAVLAQCAKRAKADYIITRNTDDFRNSPVPPLAPDEFLAAINNV